MSIDLGALAKQVQAKQITKEQAVQQLQQSGQQANIPKTWANVIW